MKHLNYQARVFRTAILAACVLILTGCPKGDKKPDPGRVGISTSPVSASPTPPPIPGAIAFNGERAMDHVRWQVELGPRPPGSPEAIRVRDYIVSELKKYGLAATTDPFSAATPEGEVRMSNITAEIPGESSDVLIIASHWDTKLYKDMHFVGANDPGASVGTLLELARVITGLQQKPKLTYWIVFFDGEEAFCRNWEDCGDAEAPDNTYGSRRYVDELRRKGELSRIKALILLDMIGYKNLELGRDTMSTRWLQDVIWQTGRELGYESIFVNRDEAVGGDDHEPFLRAGVDAVDIIQLNSYPHWHTPEDTIDKVSARSMKIVGDVVLASLPRVEQRILSRRK
ncbi:MAG TPA: M28 family peptidase [Pyrinomonadaceae bacterium]|nr:M28 family peptidase [Pyrinomonadaceae bacterium]